MLEDLLEDFYQNRKEREELDLSNQNQKKMMEELEKLEFQKLINVLIDDVNYAIKEFNKNNNGSTRRSFIRNVFSFIEGEIHVLVQEILTAAKHSRLIELEAEEILALKEKSPQVQNNGKIKAVTKHIDLLNKIKIAFKYYAKVFELKYELDISNQHWQIFQKALKVRHRITHPKEELDMNISDQEIVEVYISYHWFKLKVNEMLNKRIEAMKQQELGRVRF